MRFDGHLDSPTLWTLERMAAIMTSIPHTAGSESSRNNAHLHQRYTIWLEIPHHAQTLTGRSTRIIFAHHLPSQWKRSRLDFHYGNWTSTLLARLPRATTGSASSCHTRIIRVIRSPLGLQSTEARLSSIQLGRKMVVSQLHPSLLIVPSLRCLIASYACIATLP